MITDVWKIDYQHILAKAAGRSVEDMISLLCEELPHVWCEAYRKMSDRQTSIMRIQHNAFDYIYDAYAWLEVTGAVPYTPYKESRLVAVLGLSGPSRKVRDDYRLKGWVGPTEQMYGSRWDKGHFVANSIGGAVDRLEINVFVQRRDLNRGWSAEGRRYREMEKYCMLNPGTFCLSRPIYTDETSRPAFLEYGVLKSTGELWVELFDNR